MTFSGDSHTIIFLIIDYCDKYMDENAYRLLFKLERISHHWSQEARRVIEQYPNLWILEAFNSPKKPLTTMSDWLDYVIPRMVSFKIWKLSKQLIEDDENLTEDDIVDTMDQIQGDMLDWTGRPKEEYKEIFPYEIVCMDSASCLFGWIPKDIREKFDIMMERFPDLSGNDIYDILDTTNGIVPTSMLRVPIYTAQKNQIIL